jgi:integrase
MARPKRKREYGMGGITPRKGRSGQIRWQVRYRLNGHRRAKSFADYEKAERFRRKMVGAAEEAGAGLQRDPRSVPILAKLIPPLIEARMVTHRAADKDRSRWNCHLTAMLGPLRPDEVDNGVLRRLVMDRLAVTSPSNVGLCMRMLSTYYEDLKDDGHATRNPVADLPRRIRNLYKSTYDTSSTPHLEYDDMVRLLFELPTPVNVAYAIGGYTGMRDGEIVALLWPHIFFDRRLIHVQRGMVTARNPTGKLKDNDSRWVPIMDPLYEILTRWREVVPGNGLVIPPLRHGGKHLHPDTLRRELAAALTRLQLPKVTWYQATKHSFATEWIKRGGTAKTLQHGLGHSSVATTERYEHSGVSMFGATERGLLPPLGQDIGSTLTTRPMRGMRRKLLNPE